MTQVMLEHFPLRSCSAILHPASTTKEMEHSEGLSPAGDRRHENTQAPFWRWKTHYKEAVQHEGSAERKGSTHNWTQGHQLPDGGHAVTGSFKGRNSSETQGEDAERVI